MISSYDSIVQSSVAVVGYSRTPDQHQRCGMEVWKMIILWVQVFVSLYGKTQ